MGAFNQANQFEYVYLGRKDVHCSCVEDGEWRNLSNKRRSECVCARMRAYACARTHRTRAVCVLPKFVCIFLSGSGLAFSQKGK